jgi:DNA mismatch repair protein MutS
MDEIGRGTATYDGISIAWAIAEYLVTHPDHAAKTLFATHYHELQDLEKHHSDKIKNYHMAIEEHKENPVFLYRLTRGGAHGSYAIAVAKLAGVPDNVTKRATELLKDFDKKET